MLLFENFQRLVPGTILNSICAWVRVSVLGYGKTNMIFFCNPGRRIHECWKRELVDIAKAYEFDMSKPAAGVIRVDSRAWGGLSLTYTPVQFEKLDDRFRSYFLNKPV